jgi:carbon monoxide dehydrogenase subunit G
MPELRASRTLTISIAASAAEVYAFMAEPRRLSEWATGLGSAPTPLPDGAWRVETRVGPMRVVFAPANEFGVVDHIVFPLTGGDAVADVPLRVVANGTGSEVMLTVFQQPGMSEVQYAADTALVQADLERLKRAVERRHT